MAEKLTLHQLDATHTSNSAINTRKGDALARRLVRQLKRIGVRVLSAPDDPHRAGAAARVIGNVLVLEQYFIQTDTHAMRAMTYSPTVNERSG